MEKSEILSTISQVLNNLKGENGWVDLAIIGKPLNDLGVNYKSIGYLKLRELLEDFPNEIELKRDTSHALPVIYARMATNNNRAKVALKKNLAVAKTSKQTIPSKLLQWAWLGDFRQRITDLRNLALKERWYYKTQNPTFPYPILSQYLIYTFFRLSKERGKILTNERYAAFNTGLVNELYEPIYALFDKNKLKGKQEWYFQEFCISGVGRAGKILASNFNPLPERANYFGNVSDLIYDIKAPEPQLDWNHIILDNVARLPMEFLEENKPTGFLFRDTQPMNTIERNEYFESLSSAISNDGKTFRAIKNRFADALALALKRVSWNFKTAIPMYYPTQNKLSLLLPLSLTDDEIIDLALVVEKTGSGNYLGHTILPLSWAYSNARLITRPDSDWLVAELIDTQVSVEEDDESDE